MPNIDEQGADAESGTDVAEATLEQSVVRYPLVNGAIAGFLKTGVVHVVAGAGARGTRARA